MDTNNKSYGFTAADLTLAALSFPFIQPHEMQHWLVEPTNLPPIVKELCDELIATKAGQHVLKIYKQHRIPTKDSVVVMKGAERNKKPWEGMSLLWPAGILLGTAAAVYYTVSIK